jgi:hypothetical protein
MVSAVTTIRRGANRRGWVAAGLALAVAAWPARAAGPAGADPAAVEQAIARGRDYLFAHQQDGNWEKVQVRNPKDYNGPSVENQQWGGMTALATLALLASGTSNQDPHVKSAVEFLRKADLRGTYALGFRAQVWGLLPLEPWVKRAALDDEALLRRGLITNARAGPAVGLYSYGIPGAAGDADHSVSQFGVLGMWSLSQAGIEVPTSYWNVVDGAWRHQQTPAGGWAYRAAPRAGEPSESLSMTAAGVATLFITQEYTRMAARCAGNPDDPAIAAGLKYLGDHLGDLPAEVDEYVLFAISRVGLASGYKYLGTTDWFRWGADRLCHEQNGAGAWTNGYPGFNDNNVPNTALALLFLSRGRAPVMVNKLRYDVSGGPGGDAGKAVPAGWNQRPRDVANLSRWIGRQIESTLNWQVVTLGESAEDLHDAPILYIAGGKAPRLSPEDAAQLRAYAEDGGLILGHADCASPEFAAGFRQLGEQMFPGRRFRTLEPTSPIYTNETFPAAAWKTGAPAVEALTNGSREMMVLLPTGDPARQWQTQSFQAIRKDVAGQLMLDLFLYAVDKEGLRQRGDTYLVARDAAVPAARPVKVARLRYAGNWDPEPGGWRRLANVMHDAGAADLTIEAVNGPIDKSYALASVTFGGADARLTESERSAIRDYVKGGGTLLVDCAGGRSAYRVAAEAELARIFPDAPRDLPVLPADSPVYTAGKIGPVKSVSYRRFERAGNPHAPQLRGYAIGDRMAVLYSPEDVSTGLVGEPVDGVAGYDPASATAVVEHAVLYAAR